MSSASFLIINSCRSGSLAVVLQTFKMQCKYLTLLLLKNLKHHCGILKKFQRVTYRDVCVRNVLATTIAIPIIIKVFLSNIRTVLQIPQENT